MAPTLTAVSASNLSLDTEGLAGVEGGGDVKADESYRAAARGTPLQRNIGQQ